MKDHLSREECQALLDRELDPAEEFAALEHLLSCRDCREAHGALAAAATALAEFGLGAPAAAGRLPRRPLALGALAAAAALIAALSWFARTEPREASKREATSAGALVVHSLVVTTTRESDGIVSRDTRRVAPGGAFERSRERIRPEGKGSFLMALRRADTHGGTSR